MTGQWAILGLLILIAAGVDSSVARADRDEDLRADEALLQSRLDRQAQLPSSGDVYGVGPNNPAAMAPVTGGSFPRSILIPGTETSLRVSGQIVEIAAYWFSGGQPNAGLGTISPGGSGLLQSVPVQATRGHARGDGIFGQSPAASRISFNTSTPSAWGDVRTFVEFDWAGSNAFVPGGKDPTSVSDDLVPRLRYAYGTIGGWLFGQANSNFRDPDADSETIDFGGDVGGPGIIRIPQVRYTTPTGLWDSQVSLSAEAPETDLGTPAGIIADDSGFTTPTNSCVIAAPGSNVTCSLTTGPAIAKTTMPTFVAAWFIPHRWGHVDFAVVTRPGLDVNDGKFVSRQFVGYGGQVSGVYEPGWLGWAKDNFHWHVTLGTGIGGYIEGGPTFALATNYPSAGPPATPAAALAVQIKPVNEIGWTAGYQHFWSPEWRSTISVGFYHFDVPTQIVGAAEAINLNKEMDTAHLNLFWRPVSFVDIGVEYMFGRGVAPSNRKGNENVMLSAFRFRF